MEIDFGLINNTVVTIYMKPEMGTLYIFTVKGVVQDFKEYIF